MAQLGTDKQPVMLNTKKRGKILGSTGSWYKTENKKKYEKNYDKIFGDKNVRDE